MTENERKAQRAWLCYVTERLEHGTASHATFTEWLVACKPLTYPEKDAHDAWRGTVTAALQKTVQSFHPGEGPVSP